MLQLPLAAGDKGIQQLVRVRSSVSTVGTFNVHIMRRLFSARIPAANFGEVMDWGKTGLPEIFADSALRLVVRADSTATGLPMVNMIIGNG